MSHVQLRLATDADCLALAEGMREADALETWRSLGMEPLDALRASMATGNAEVLVIDGQLAAMFGLAKHDLVSPVAVPWLLTTSVVERHRATFFKIARAIVDRWAKENPVLVQMVDDEYEGAKAFLERLGFELHPPVPHGPYGAPFRPAVRTTTNV